MNTTQTLTAWEARRTPVTAQDIAARKIVDAHLDLLIAAAERFGSLDAGLAALIAMQKGVAA